MIVLIGATGGLGSELCTHLFKRYVVRTPDRSLLPLHNPHRYLWPDEPFHVINAAGVCDNTSIKVNLQESLTLLHALPVQCKSVLFFGSVVAEIGVSGTLAYSASKAGLHGLVRSAARQLAPMRVNCLDLGYFDRGMIHHVPASTLERTLKAIPLGRLGNGKDLDSAVEFHLSCEYLTGAVVKLNGGLT